MKPNNHSLSLASLASLWVLACGSNGADGGASGMNGARAGGGSISSAGTQAAGSGAGNESSGGVSNAGGGSSGTASTPEGGAAGSGMGGFGAGGVNGAGTAGSVGTAGSAGAGGMPNGIEQWHPFDIVLGGSSTSQLNDTLSATFTGPTGQTLRVPGFFAGAAGWTVRFAPTAVGAWSYNTSSSVAALSGKSGTVQCVANSNPRVHGKVIVDAAHTHYFKYEDGSPYLMMGFEADWLALMDFNDAGIPKAKSLVDIYASHGFNQVLMNLFAYDTTWRSGQTAANDFGPPTGYPWSGSNGSPDQTRMNPSFFLNYDRVMQYLLDRGIVAHIFLKVYNKGVNWPAKASQSDDLYFRHVLARYQAYPNVLWDFSKESNYETDIAYKSGRIKMIHDLDAYHHPVSTHTDPTYYASAASKGLLDFRTDQNQDAFYSTIISHRNSDPWPVINSEYDYEIGNDGGKTYSHANDKLTVLKNACEVAMAGGHLVYYYTYHAWDVVHWSEVPDGLAYQANLYAVLSSSNWSALAPSDNLIDNAGSGRHCLATQGAEYLVFLAGSGSASLNVKQIPAGTTLHGKWVNLTSGQEQAIPALGNGQLSLTNPWSSPALAHLSP